MSKNKISKSLNFSFIDYLKCVNQYERNGLFIKCPIEKFLQLLVTHTFVHTHTYVRQLVKAG